MIIDVLYFEGCPNHPPTVDRVKDVVLQLGITVDIREVLVSSQEEAVKHHFFGSPSVQVDGIDIDPKNLGHTKYTFSCRIYGDSGLPPRNMLIAAIQSSR